MTDSPTQHGNPTTDQESKGGSGKTKTPWSDKLLGSGCLVIVLFFLFCIFLVAWFWGTLIFG